MYGFLEKSDSSVQMKKGAHTVVALDIGLPSVLSWKVCNKRKPVTYQEEISWRNLQPITNSMSQNLYCLSRNTYFTNFTNAVLLSF